MALALTLAGSSLSAAPADTVASVEPEEANVATIPPPALNWFYVDGGWGTTGTSIFDGETGKMRGMVDTSHLSDMAIDPAGKYYYVAESIWSKGGRGTRQDMVSVYDSAELKLQAEIAIPERILIGGRKQTFVLSDDGKIAFVYNLSPASSVNVVDLVKRKFVRNIELPGCASLIPNPGVGFSALCSDGSLATVALGGAKPQITRTAPFFAATDNPIFDNFVYDKSKREAIFLTYTGDIYTAKMGATPVISKPFSLQAAAGIRPGETKPLDLNWYPGGGQMTALHRPTGHLYVLMHMGEYWSHKAEGTEIWKVDVAAQKVVKRIPLKDPMVNVAISQEEKPLLFLNNRKGDGIILDGTTFEEKHKIENAGSGLITVAEPG
ncbi:amine dehydrogenase large subunit [Sphingobium algorifonticola]|uniref:amine dehydrogenase large subunit n=1 Tax=Sphingobium algorifonticola TaxID=2008318 RepID=UPI001F4976E8|nr:amine dehydrogenase large subunit [Sphingobium algorifonticola]